MAEMTELLNQARTLGEAIAANPKVKSFLAAQADVSADAEAQRLLADYQRHAQEMQQLASEQKPIEPELKHKLASCEQAMASHESLKRLMRAQADYIDVMNAINQAMEEPLARQIKSPPE
jgi:cell fate (sporulation/competence/biofilm development) regulator YlbF (YheA/YmcA/DUF963 family)